jgi:hypothetical protein
MVGLRGLQFDCGKTAQLSMRLFAYRQVEAWATLEPELRTCIGVLYIGETRENNARADEVLQMIQEG